MVKHFLHIVCDELMCSVVIVIITEEQLIECLVPLNTSLLHLIV
jgi:hypothetical protein